MRLLALVYILIFISKQSYSQKIVFEYDPQFKAKAEGKPFSTLRLYSDDSGKIVYIIHNEEKIIYLLLSNDFVIEKKLSPPAGIKGSIYQYEGNRALGGVVNDRSGIAYSIHRFIKANPHPDTKRREHFRLETIDFANQKISEQAFFEPGEDEHYIADLTYKNKFYLITCFNEPGQLTVRILDENGSIIKKDFPLSQIENVLGETTVFDYLSPATPFVGNTDYRTLGADYPVKVYMENEKTILFTLATQKRTPELLRLDLETLQTDFIQISTNELCISDDKKNPNLNNSYFYNDRLYVLNICKRKVQVCIFNFSTLALEAKYELSENSTFEFAETPVMYTNRDGRRGMDYLIYKTDILREIYKGAPKIYAMNDQLGNTVITFGMFSDRSGSEARFTRSPSSSTQIPAGTNGGSNIRNPRPITDAPQVFYSNDLVLSMRAQIICKIVIDPSNKLIKLKPPPTTFTQAVDYGNKLDRIYSNKAFMQIHGKYYAEYFNIATRTLCIEEIPIKY